ncbi:MAG: GumC family protein [Mucilaginibacter sp.]
MSDFSNTSSQDNEFALKQPVNILELVRKYVYHWPVFLLCLFLSVGAMYLYLRYTPRIYNIRATLLIKDDSQNASSQISQINLFSRRQGIQNEIEILNSKIVMRQVVQNLNLNIVYKLKGLAYNTDVYNREPFHIVFADKEKIGPAKWEITIIDENNYQILEGNSSTPINGRFGSTQPTRFGNCIIEKSNSFLPYIGKTIYVLLDDPDDKANMILGSLIVTSGINASSTIELSLNDQVPKRGKDILNNLINVYNDASIADKNQIMKNSIRFINDRLAYIGRDLDSVERVEEDYKISHGITEVSSKAQAFEQNVKQNDDMLNEVNLQIGSLDEITSFVKNPKANDAISLIGISDPTILDLVRQLQAAQAQYEQLLETTGPANPIVKNKEKLLKRLNITISSSIKHLRASVVAKRNLLLTNNSKFEGQIRTIPEEERQLVSIIRNKTIKENLYVMLLQKKEEAALSTATTVPDSRVIEPPYDLKSPVSPKKGTLYLFSIVIGLFVPVIYVFSKDALNFRVISHKDITDRTSVPIIGDIMYRDDSPAIVIGNNSRTLIAEQFRSIRTYLQAISGKHQDGKVTIFTSSMSGEGKSFISSNVAVSLAITNRKTVIIELDLRKPKISQYMQHHSKIGLSDYLTGQASKEEILQQSDIHPNLFLISAGTIPANPAELLEEQHIDELIYWLKSKFAEIVIDTPPVGLVTDALVLSRFADVSIYVVRHGFTLKSQIAALESLYQEKKFPKLNIILNGVQSEGRFGYGYETQYGYGYAKKGYSGYYTNDTVKSKSNGLLLLVRNFLKRF